MPSESMPLLAGALAIFVIAVLLLLREVWGGGERHARAPGHTPDAVEEEDLTKVAQSKLPKLAPASDESGSFSKSAAVTLYADDISPVEDETTGPIDRILTSAVGQTDPGRRRSRNEDSFIVMPEEGLFAVADGVGGHAGGDIASAMAMLVVGNAFRTGKFKGEPDPLRPRRANELVWAIDAANEAIHAKARSSREFAGMATTLLCARFTTRKRRVYVAHVGDSPAFRLRDGALKRLTVDHTLARSGVTGPMAAHLSRALGITSDVAVDVVIDAPQPGDRYLLCSDGLSKMVPAAQIADVLGKGDDPRHTAEELVRVANERGGADNITVIVIRIDGVAGAPRQ